MHPISFDNTQGCLAFAIRRPTLITHKPSSNPKFRLRIYKCPHGFPLIQTLLEHPVEVPLWCLWLKPSHTKMVFMVFTMAPLRRFERPTYRLGGGCSILLSYKGIFNVLWPPPVTCLLLLHWTIKFSVYHPKGKEPYFKNQATIRKEMLNRDS